MDRKIQKVAVVGTGTLGAQIAIQASFYGYEVSAYDLDERSFEKALKRMKVRIENSGRTPTLSVEELKEGAKKVKLCLDMEEACLDADLVIEAVPENLSLKRNIFQRLDSLAPREAILASNSSSIPISKIESATTRPEKCLNMHFYSLDLGRNMVDIMGGTRTRTETIDAGKEWVRSIGCVPLTVKKEILGFCFNRVWRAIKREALHMWADGFVDFRDIDRGWMIWTGMSQGPFGFMDAVGLDVVYGIEMIYYSESKKPTDHPPEALKAMVDRGDLGVKAGKGFYTYPNPEYKSSDFLKR
ncbi:MAG: 3-hydroxyacyl-CoA dehydrogenase [Deltaproteobacteria bacterium]|nr:3-hydroxyacyl-CoA dehydrogenase [Deltaproteobacteria bacterium]